MDGRSDKNLTCLPAGKNGSKLTLIDIIQNIVNANNNKKKKTVEEGLLNPDNNYCDPVSPRNSMETPKGTKRRRESEPPALGQAPTKHFKSKHFFALYPARIFAEYGDMDPDCASNNSFDHTWQQIRVKKPMRKTSTTPEQKLTQTKKLTSAPKHNEETNEPTWSEINKGLRPNLEKNEQMGEKPYECSYCDYRTKKNSNLVRHERIHTGEKPYKCGHCDYRASHISNLRQHERTHAGEKPYRCDQCDYKATQSSTLRAHERTHTGEKPYKCDHCDYRASQSNALRRHNRTHTGEKPYMCRDCDYRASQISTLRQHQRTHTREKTV